MQASTKFIVLGRTTAVLDPMQYSAHPSDIVISPATSMGHARTGCQMEQPESDTVGVTDARHVEETDAQYAAEPATVTV